MSAARAGAALWIAFLFASSLRGGDDAAQEPESTTIEVGDDGLSVESGDGGFALRLRALVQADGRFYFGDERTTPTNGMGSSTSTSDDYLIRRARLELTGRLFERLDFRLMPDFAPRGKAMLDAWLRLTLRPQLQLQVGKIKLPIGLEREQNRDANLFNEFAYPTALVPNRDLGINAQGRVERGVMTYYVGLYDGAPDGASVIGGVDRLDTVAARLFATPRSDGPLGGLGIGVAATRGEREGPASSYHTIGQQTFWRTRTGVVVDGVASRLAGLLDYFHGRYGLISEYVVSRQPLRLGAAEDRVAHSAWNVTLAWVLTGEDATFDGVEPEHPVDCGSGRWGAWQLVVRATGLDVDDGSFPVFADPAVSSSRAGTLGIGMHWIMTERLQMTLDYDSTELEGGALDHEDVAIARVQLRF